MSNRMLLILVFCMASLWIFGLLYGGSSQQYQQGSSLGSGPAGSSLFRQFLSRMKPERVTLMKKALLSSADLEDVSTYVLFAPKRKVTPREAAFLRTFVEQGGMLLLSAHSKDTLNNVAPIIMQFSQGSFDTLGTDRFLPFQNQKIVHVESHGEESLHRPGNIYAMYSNLQFTNACPSTQVGCFFKTFRSGKGVVFFWLGLSPLSNGLIAEEDNRLIALEILNRSDGVVFDEYHHYFTDKTVWDLLVTPAFLFPIVGLLLVGLTYLLFGYSGFHQYAAMQESHPPDIHDVQVGIITGAIKKRGYRREAMEELQSLLKNMYPERHAEIDVHVPVSEASPARIKDAVTALLKWHRTILSNKGI